VPKGAPARRRSPARGFAARLTGERAAQRPGGTFLSVGGGILPGVTEVALGFWSRTGSAVAVAVGGSAERPRFLGRWDVDLTDGQVPDQMYHAAAGMPAERQFIERTIGTVVEVTTTRMREIASQAGATCAGVVVGDHPVPDALEKVLASHLLTHAAEGRLYRDALVDAAGECGLPMTCLPRADATAWLARRPYDTAIAELGRTAGGPWRKEHKLAAVVALAALTGRS